MSSRKGTSTGTKVGLAVVIIFVLEIASDGAVMAFLGGWALLVLPFMILLQAAFDFILLVAIAYWWYSGGSRTRVIR